MLAVRWRINVGKLPYPCRELGRAQRLAPLLQSYHQDYLVHHPNSPYIAFTDQPKIDNFNRIFPDLYTDRPARVTSR